jgi:hypothetical protein
MPIAANCTLCYKATAYNLMTFAYSFICLRQHGTLSSFLVFFALRAKKHQEREEFACVSERRKSITTATQGHDMPGTNTQ